MAARVDREALAAQPFGERLGDRVLVLDQQDLHGTIVADEDALQIGVFPNLCRSFPQPCRTVRPLLAGDRRTVSGMNRRHAFLIALVLGIAAVLGAYAATRTAHLGAARRTRRSRRRSPGANRS